MLASLDPFDFAARWGSAWSGNDIVFLRNEVEVERLHAPDIHRVIFVESADDAGELSFALVELPGEFMVVPADIGFATRVHFERQAFWAAKPCVYWSDALSARLPADCLARRGLTLARLPRLMRVPGALLAPLVEQWLIEGPQSREERRWLRRERARTFARIDTHIDSVPPAMIGRRA